MNINETEQYLFVDQMNVERSCDSEISKRLIPIYQVNRSYKICPKQKQKQKKL